MAKLRVETYEQGTGRLISAKEIEVPEPPEPELTEEEKRMVRQLIVYAKKMGWIHG